MYGFSIFSAINSPTTATLRSVPPVRCVQAWKQFACTRRTLKYQTDPDIEVTYHPYICVLADMRRLAQADPLAKEQLEHPEVLRLLVQPWRIIH